MIRVPLRAASGAVRAYALLDDCDAQLADFIWSESCGYATRRTWPECDSLYMHREVLGLVKGDGRLADHINGNRLDNRRANLRVCTPAENGQNHRRGRGTSRFRGVYWNRQQQKWMARVKLNYRHHYLGVFDDEVTAARVADAYRQRHMPFAQPDPALIAIDAQERAA